MNYITDYLLEVDFPYHDKIIKYKDDILNQYYKFLNSRVEDGKYNIKYDNEELTKKVTRVFEETLKKYFIISPRLNELGLYIYVSTKDSFDSQWHNHTNISTISSTFYLETNDKGGGLEFMDFKEPNTVIYPKINKLYIFPSWMYHKPLPPEDEKVRICINMDYYCYQRPQCKGVKIKTNENQQIPLIW